MHELYKNAGQAYTSMQASLSTYQVDANAAPTLHLGNSIQSAALMIERVEALADVLCGSVPRGVDSNSQKMRSGGGLFGDIATAADELNERVARAESALDRITNLLPSPPINKG